LKKLASLALILLLLCGCAKGKTADVTKEMRESGGFSAYATVHYLDKEYGFTVEKDPETIRVVLDTPQALSGFTVSLTENDYTIGYHDVSFSTKQLPDTMERVIGPVFSLCDAIAKQEGEHLPDSTFTYQSGEWSATCRFDPKEGVPLQISVGDDFLLEFTDFKYT